MQRANARLALCLNCVLNVKVLVVAFNQDCDCENRWDVCIVATDIVYTHTHFVGPEVFLDKKRPRLSQYFYYKFPCVESRYPTTPLPS